MRWIWIPGEKCGEFRLGGPFQPRAYSLDIVRLERACKGADWKNYRVGEEEARLRVCEDRIAAVECTESLVLHDQEIIGAAESGLAELLGHVPVCRRRWPDGSAMLEVPELGLTLWLEAGHVESATVEPLEP